LIGVITHRAAHLGREDDIVPSSLERLADDLFGVSVGVGGVDEVDSRVQRFVDDAGRVVGVGLPMDVANINAPSA
jgi:hypothetical protein